MPCVHVHVCTYMSLHTLGGGSANNTGEVGTVTHLRRPDVHTAWKFRTPSPLRGLHFPRGLTFLPETMLSLISRSDPHVGGGQGPRLGAHFLGPLQHPACCCPLNRSPSEQLDGWGLASMGDPRAWPLNPIQKPSRAFATF